MYSVESLDEAAEQEAALPAEALAPYAELRTLLEVSPWSGESQNAKNPGASMRSLVFGKRAEGFVTYLILEDQRRVVILLVVWVG